MTIVNTDNEINTILGRMLGTEGVLMCIFFTAEGSILGAKMNVTIKAQSEKRICNTLTGMMESLDYFCIQPEDIIYKFGSYDVLIKAVDNRYLLIMNDLSVNRSMLNIAINVTIKKLKSLLQVSISSEIGMEKEEVPMPFKPLEIAPEYSASDSTSKDKPTEALQERNEAPQIIIKKLSSEESNDHEAENQKKLKKSQKNFTEHDGFIKF